MGEDKKTKKEKIKFEKIELKGVNLSNFISSKFKKAIEKKLGKVAFPIILMVLEQGDTLVVFSHESEEAIKKKILSVQYNPTELSTKQIIELREFLQKFGDMND